MVLQDSENEAIKKVVTQFFQNRSAAGLCSWKAASVDSPHSRWEQGNLSMQRLSVSTVGLKSISSKKNQKKDVHPGTFAGHPRGAVEDQPIWANLYLLCSATVRCWTTPYTNVIQLHTSAHCQVHISGQLIFPRLYDRVYFISQLKKYFFLMWNIR